MFVPKISSFFIRETWPSMAAHIVKTTVSAHYHININIDIKIQTTNNKQLNLQSGQPKHLLISVIFSSMPPVYQFPCGFLNSAPSSLFSGSLSCLYFSAQVLYITCQTSTIYTLVTRTTHQSTTSPPLLGL